MCKITSRKRKAILWLAVFAATFSLCVWSVANLLRPIPRVRLDTPGEHAVIGFSADNLHFLTAGTRVQHVIGDRNIVPPIFVWDAQNGTKLSTIDWPVPPNITRVPNYREIRSVTFSPDGEKITVAMKWPENVVVANVSSKIYFDINYSMSIDYHLSVLFSPDSESLAVCGTQPFLFDLGNEKETFWIDDGFAMSSRLSAPSTRPIRIPSTDRQVFSFSKGGHWLIYNDRVNHPKQIKVWKISHEIKLIEDVEADDIRVSRDGTVLKLKLQGRWTELSLGEEILRSNFKVEGLSTSKAEKGKNEELEAPVAEGDYQFYSDDGMLQVDFTDGGSLAARRRGCFANSEYPALFRYKRWDISKQKEEMILSIACTSMDASNDGKYIFDAEREGVETIDSVSLKWRNLKERQETILRKVGSVDSAISVCLGKNGTICAAEFMDSSPRFGSLTKFIQIALDKAQEWSGIDMEMSWIGRECRVAEIWDGPKGKLLGTIRNQFALDLSPDCKTFATQDEKYNIYFWDVPPSRNWPLAAGMAIVPAMIATGLLLAVVSLGHRIFRRLRPTSVKSN